MHGVNPKSKIQNRVTNRLKIAIAKIRQDMAMIWDN